MSSNSLNLRNIRDAVYNNLYLINEEGGLDNIRDLLGISTEELNAIMAEIAKKAPIDDPTFTTKIKTPAITLGTTDLQFILNNKAGITAPVLTGDVTVRKTTGDAGLWIETLNNGSSSVIVFSANASIGKLIYSSSGLLQFMQKNDATTYTDVVGLEVYPNGVLSVGNKQNNKLFVLKENGTSSDPLTSTNFHGFGYSTRAMLPNTFIRKHTQIFMRYYCSS